MHNEASSNYPSMYMVLESYTENIHEICKTDTKINEDISRLDIKEWVNMFDSSINEFVNIKFISPIVNAVSFYQKRT